MPSVTIVGAFPFLKERLAGVPALDTGALDGGQEIGPLMVAEWKGVMAVLVVCGKQ